MNFNKEEKEIVLGSINKTINNIINIDNIKQNILGQTSISFKIDEIPALFFKKNTKYFEYNVYEREKYLSSILNQFNWYPTLLYHDDNEKILIFKHVGVPLTKDNCPDDIVPQFNKILSDMKSVNVQHNDIKPGELLIDNSNKIYLCDFGWGSINNELGCGINIWNKTNKDKPYGWRDDSTALERMDLSICDEIHLLIDWTNYFQTLEPLINKSLKLIETIHLDKLQNKQEVLSKFYRKYVDDFRGETPFTIYIVRDTNPIYEYRNTSKGQHKVNINMFDRKCYLRQITGGGYKIHATDNIQETKYNLQVLNLYNKYYKQKEFSELNDVFSELNKHPRLEWLITHNFNKFEEEDDIDFLTNDYYYFMRILDTIERPKLNYNNGVSNGGSSVRNYIKVNNKYKPIDIRYIGDNFYDKQMQIDMLSSKIKHNNFYIPNDNLYLYSLIYHSILHKDKIPKESLEVFKSYKLADTQLNKEDLKALLDVFMKEHNYNYVKPESSVKWFISNL
tara:strand:- start:2206 stop:3726 length:1521 start_codon:yes stop_codon:yes gene_type:complete